jgi:WD40 repeat protein
MAWSPDGKLLATSGPDEGDEPYPARIWDVESGKTIWSQSLPYSAHALALSEHPLKFAYAIFNRGYIQVCSMASDRRDQSFRCSPLFLSLSDDGRRLTALEEDHRYRIWDLDTGIAIRDTQGPKYSTDHPAHIAWSRDGDVAASDTEARDLHLWRPTTGEPLATFVFLNSRLLAIAPDGHYLAQDLPDLADQLLYVVKTDQGQDMLTPKEFTDKYGWKNDPEKVQLNLGVPVEPE